MIIMIFWITLWNTLIILVMDQGKRKWHVKHVKTIYSFVKGTTSLKIKFCFRNYTIYLSVWKYLMLNTLLTTSIVCRRTKNTNSPHINDNIWCPFLSLVYVWELWIIMGTRDQGGPMWQINFIKSLTWGQQEKSHVNFLLSSCNK